MEKSVSLSGLIVVFVVMVCLLNKTVWILVVGFGWQFEARLMIGFLGLTDVYETMVSFVSIHSRLPLDIKGVLHDSQLNQMWISNDLQPNGLLRGQAKNQPRWAAERKDWWKRVSSTVLLAFIFLRKHENEPQVKGRPRQSNLWQGRLSSPVVLF